MALLTHDSRLENVAGILHAAMTMELPGCFAMTETGHGSDVQSIRTTATYDQKREDHCPGTSVKTVVIHRCHSYPP